MDGKRKAAVILAMVAAGGVAVVLGLILGFLLGWHCSGGDGGVPYVAHDSPQADVCGATGNGIGLTLLLLVAALGLLVAVWRLGRAWAQRARSAAPFAATAVCVALLPVVPALMLMPFSAECTGEKRRAYEAWIEGDRPGESPYDCESY